MKFLLSILLFVISINSISAQNEVVTVSHTQAVERYKVNLAKAKTIADTNNDGFSIERSLNASDWNNIGYIKGKGESSIANKYTFLDRGLSCEIMYYRIKQIDYDGTFSYSKSILAEFDCKNSNAFTAFPNPFSTEINMSLSDKEGSQILIIDAQGKLVYNSQLSNSSNSIIPTNNWPAVLYIARHLVNGQVIKSQKLIKQGEL